MAIPEAQLATWAKQGSITQSAGTYRTIKSALVNSSTKYASRSCASFLQGSYGNDTNIYAESDVDVVIRYDGAFFHDLDDLSDVKQRAFFAAHPEGTYPYDTFRTEVIDALTSAFGNAVKPDTKAIKVAANGNRRSTDVIVAFEFRRYYDFNGAQSNDFHPGICFHTSDGTRIANFPKQHSENLTIKHQATNDHFKPVVRIFKNMRTKLVEDGIIEKGVAPSYYIEGLLYNVPNAEFAGTTWHDIVLKVLLWLTERTDRTNFLCANERYYLLRDGDPVCWPIQNGDTFIDASVSLWNDW